MLDWMCGCARCGNQPPRIGARLHQTFNDRRYLGATVNSMVMIMTLRVLRYLVMEAFAQLLSSLILSPESLSALLLPVLSRENGRQVKLVRTPSMFLADE